MTTTTTTTTCQLSPVVAALRDEACRQGLSDSEVARRMGIAQPNVSRWFSGDRDPSADVVHRLAAVLGCEIQVKTPAKRKTHATTN